MTDPKGRPQFEDLYAQARDALASGTYQPGARIGVKDLAARIVTSTTPAREILSRLVGLGLVEEHRTEGYYLKTLDEHQAASLYRLHGACVEAALRAGGAPLDLFSAPDDAWSAFDTLVAASGDAVLRDVRRYLDARLRLLRRCEAALFDDLPAEAHALAAGLGSPRRPDRRSASRVFHRRRIDAARQLAFLLTRPPRIGEI
jgi:DNA-binding transcriptional regulator YhcF (GntR family)